MRQGVKEIQESESIWPLGATRAAACAADGPSAIVHSTQRSLTERPIRLHMIRLARSEQLPPARPICTATRDVTVGYRRCPRGGAMSAHRVLTPPESGRAPLAGAGTPAGVRSALDPSMEILVVPRPTPAAHDGSGRARGKQPEGADDQHEHQLRILAQPGSVHPNTLSSGAGLARAANTWSRGTRRTRSPRRSDPLQRGSSGSRRRDRNRANLGQVNGGDTGGVRPVAQLPAARAREQQAHQPGDGDGDQ